MIKILKDIFLSFGFGSFKQEPQQQKFKVKFVEDPPILLNNYVIYIVGENSQHWFMLYNCPCGCQKKVYLNLLKDANPCWRFYLNKKRQVTIAPSVWKKDGCRSHYFIRRGKVIWCTDRRW